MVALMTLEQAFDHPSVSEVTLKDVGKIDHSYTTTLHEMCAYSLGRVAHTIQQQSVQ